MFCKNCGKELSADAKFCDNCGTAIQEFVDSSDTGTLNKSFIDSSRQEKTHQKTNTKYLFICFIAIVLFGLFLILMNFNPILWGIISLISVIGIICTSVYHFNPTNIKTQSFISQIIDLLSFSIILITVLYALFTGFNITMIIIKLGVIAIPVGLSIIIRTIVHKSITTEYSKEKSFLNKWLK